MNSQAKLFKIIRIVVLTIGAAALFLAIAWLVMMSVVDRPTPDDGTVLDTSHLWDAT